jgi:hypothetical protein
MGAQDQRPRFYEGQYLSADDLAAIMEYQRAADARHALGGHTWGIAAGLTLTERPSPGVPDKVEVTLQPGIAWDGYGRAIVVSQPTRLPESEFARIPVDPVADDPPPPGSPSGRLVPVWLQYQEIGARPPAPGFETCLTEDQTGRVRESFQFIVSDLPEGPEQRGPVHIGAIALDATQAVKRFDPDAEELWDTSVPHQTFPIDSKPPRRWLVPIGYARWIARAGGLGYFIKRDKLPGDKVEDRIRRFRRYVGTVAEYIQAAAGVILLHRRGEPPNRAHRFAQLLQSGADAGELMRDLVWVEGNLRIEGDAKLAGGALLFRDLDGEDEGTPISIARTGDGAAGGGNRELRVVIGPGTQDDNRFIVGPAGAGSPPGISPHLAVVSSGNVGIGTANPRPRLEVAGAAGLWGTAALVPDASKGAHASHVHWDATGDWYIRSAASGGKVVIQDTGGNVGIGTTAPGNSLHVARPSHLNAVFDRTDTSDHLTVVVGSNGSGLRFSETNAFFIASQPYANRNDNSFGNEHLRITAAGKVGIATTNPRSRLEVAGAADTWGTAAFVADAAKGSQVSHVHWGATGDWYIRSAASTGKVLIQDGGGEVGIGTSSPDRELHIKEASSSSANGLRVENADNTRNMRLWVGTGGGVVDAYSGANLHLRTNGADRLFIQNATGRVGIGTISPSYTVDVNGDLRVTGTGYKNTWGGHWIFVSDATLKKDIAPIENALDRMLALRGVSFAWREPEKFGSAGGRHLGMLAQEVERVFPEWVIATPEGTKALGLQGFEALVVEALRELNAKCERLEAELSELRAGRGEGKGRA